MAVANLKRLFDRGWHRFAGGDHRFDHRDPAAAGGCAALSRSYAGDSFGCADLDRAGERAVGKIRYETASLYHHPDGYAVGRPDLRQSDADRDTVHDDDSDVVTAFHFSKKYLTFSYLTSIAVLVLMYLLFPVTWNHMTIYERFALLYILTGQYLILMQLIHRGRDMMERLIRSAHSQRDLMVKNIIMERLSKTDALTDLYNHRTFQEIWNT